MEIFSSIFMWFIVAVLVLFAICAVIGMVMKRLTESVSDASLKHKADRDAARLAQINAEAEARAKAEAERLAENEKAAYDAALAESQRIKDEALQYEARYFSSEFNTILKNYVVQDFNAFNVNEAIAKNGFASYRVTVFRNKIEFGNKYVLFGAIGFENLPDTVHLVGCANALFDSLVEYGILHNTKALVSDKTESLSAYYNYKPEKRSAI